MLIASKNEFDTNKRLIALFSFVSFFSLCLMPFIPIQKGFYIRPEDLLLPFILFIIYPYLKILKNWYFVILASWAIYGIITMALNGRLNAYNDYFELYKLFKFAVFILLFYIFFKVNKEVFKPVVIVFSILFIFNLLHFYNVFQFNELIMPSFATNSAQLDFFGKNSLGGPATKRILGTMGNPNINGILFSFFAIYFIRFLKLKNWHWGQLFFFLSITMILLTQSRTCMLALGVYLLYFVFIEKVGWWIFLKLLIGILISIVIVRMMDELSLGYVSNAKFNVAENGSLRGRLEVWAELWSMIKEKPIIGYGINKNYFYAHQLYSENEYILMVWRYGAIGLIFYLAMFFSPLKLLKNWKDVKTEKSIFFILLLILFSINGLTNNPISDPVLQLLFGIGLAYYLSQFELHEKKIKNA